MKTLIQIGQWFNTLMVGTAIGILLGRSFTKEFTDITLLCMVSTSFVMGMTVCYLGWKNENKGIYS